MSLSADNHQHKDAAAQHSTSAEMDPLQPVTIDDVAGYSDAASAELSKSVHLNAVVISIEQSNKAHIGVMMGFQIPVLLSGEVCGFTARELQTLLTKNADTSPYLTTGAEDIAARNEQPLDELVESGMLRVRSADQQQRVFFPTPRYFETVA